MLPEDAGAGFRSKRAANGSIGVEDWGGEVEAAAWEGAAVVGEEGPGDYCTAWKVDGAVVAGEEGGEFFGVVLVEFGVELLVG